MQLYISNNFPSLNFFSKMRWTKFNLQNKSFWQIFTDPVEAYEVYGKLEAQTKLYMRPYIR